MRPAAGLAVLGLVAACGLKAAPRPPELVRPGPPESVSAVSAPQGVRLTWQRPTRYSGGGRMDDLEGFMIERAPADAVPLAYTRVGTLDLTDQTRFRKDRHMQWIDGSAEEGVRYLYRVIAFTMDGDRSAPGGPVTVRFEPPPAAKPGKGP